MGIFSKDINVIIDYIERLREELKLLRGKNRRLAQLIDYGVQIAKMLVPTDTGDLADSIVGEIFGSGPSMYGKIYIEGPAEDYAKFVEFGTGIIGEENPHQFVPYTYDINGHGEKGWRYKSRDGRFYWTMGSMPKSFMYNTFVNLWKLIGSNKTTAKWYDISFEADSDFNPYILITKK
jgi:hypothetical protein